jgi:hypothetical protein
MLLIHLLVFIALLRICGLLLDHCAQLALDLQLSLRERKERPIFRHGSTPAGIAERLYVLFNPVSPARACYLAATNRHIVVL